MDIKIILQQQIYNADYNTSKINYELDNGVKFDLNTLNKNQIKKLLKVTKKFKTYDNDMELFGND